MLPDIVAKDGVEALRERRVLVGASDHFEFSAGEYEPAPAGAELLGRGLVEGLLEGFEVAEVSRDLLGDVAGRMAADADELAVPMMVQNMEWFEWPPPLLRTTLRMSSGTAFRSVIRSSTDLAARWDGSRSHH